MNLLFNLSSHSFFSLAYNVGSYTQATALIYNKLNTGMRLVEPCPLIEGCFYRPVFDTKEGDPKVKFYTEGLEIMLGFCPA